jgi:membrane-associated phospholipid phosphatase
MIHPHFSLRLVEFFVDHRTPLLTHLFAFASFLGSAPFYALLTLSLYVAWDKHLAVRLSALILLTMSLNDILKILIANPRPFILQGTYRQKWAVSPRDAAALAAEYSTPSGHAMGSAAFYPYLVSLIRNRFVRIALVLAVLLIGLSRPYLGVHYVEDVLLGWIIGLSVALIVIRYGNRLSCLWSRCSYPAQILIATAFSLALSSISIALMGGIDSQVRELVSNCGFFTGLVIAFPLELRFVNFDPRSGGPSAKTIRCGLTIVLTAITLFGLKNAFRSLAVDTTAAGCALEYLRYVVADIVAIFLAPLIFCRMRLAQVLSPSRTT